MSSGRIPSVEGGIQPTVVDAKGDLLVATAADTVSRLAVGSNDTVLTADSSTATGLKWAAAAAGGMTLISTTTLSGASISLSSIPSTYNHLQLVIRNFKPATDNVDLYMRFNSAAGNDYNGQNFSSTGVLAFDRDYISLIQNVDNTAADGLSCVNIWDYTNTATWKFATIFSFANNATTSTQISQRNATGWHNNAAAISSITLYCSSGNFTSGTALLYGVK